LARLLTDAPQYQTSDICDDGNTLPAPVGSFKPNGFGLYDMHGNVFQWTEDCYVETYENAPTNGSPILTGDCKLRVARGGSWYNTPVFLRSAYRDSGAPDVQRNYVGFRIGRTLNP